MDTNRPQAAMDTTEHEAIASHYNASTLNLRRRKWHEERLVWTVRRGAANGGKRLFDIVLASALCIALAPVFLLAAICADRPIYCKRHRRVGQHGRGFSLYCLAFPNDRLGRFGKRLGLHRLPVLFNVLKGDMSFVGPTPRRHARTTKGDYLGLRRSEIRPGLISLQQLRQRTNMAFDDPSKTDAEYIDTFSASRDMGILLRSLLVRLYGTAQQATQDRVEILDIPLSNSTMDQAVDNIIKLADVRKPARVFFTNPHCVNIAQADSEYKKILQSADLNFADGIGMKIAGHILGRAICQNVNGTDLFPRLCAALAQSGKRMYLLGGRPEVCEGAAHWITSNYPTLALCGWHHGYIDSINREVVEHIAAARPDVLVVAMGVPVQEKWIEENIVQTGARVAMGVGGLLDFYSGRIPRAPLWLRELGLEWTYRLIQEPKRMWKRYIIGNAHFVLRVCYRRVSEALTHKRGQ